MAQDIARAHRISFVLSALKCETVRGLMQRMYGVIALAPSISEWTNDKLEAKVLRQRMRYFEAHFRRLSVN